MRERKSFIRGEREGEGEMVEEKRGQKERTQLKRGEGMRGKDGEDQKG